MGRIAHNIPLATWPADQIPVAPEPPPPLELDSEDDFVVENILHCHPVGEDESSGLLLDWTIESKSNFRNFSLRYIL